MILKLEEKGFISRISNTSQNPLQASSFQMRHRTSVARVWTCRCADKGRSYAQGFALRAMRDRPAGAILRLMSMQSLVSSVVMACHPSPDCIAVGRRNQKWRIANSLPEPVFRYFSKDTALGSQEKAIAVSILHGRNFAVCAHPPLLCFINRDFRSSVIPT